MGRLKYFLEIKLTCSKKGPFTCQRKYILDLLKETGNLATKPALTLVESKCKLNSDDGEPLKDINRFQRLIKKINLFNDN